jgi:hypothetical protein
VTLATVKSQFAAAVTAKPATPFDNVIDVEADRLRFTATSTPNTTSDTLAVTLSNEVALQQAVALSSAKLVIKGDFSFASGKDGKCATGDLNETAATSTVAGATAVYAADCQSLTVTYPVAAIGTVAAPTNDVITVTLPAVAAAKKLSPQKFNATMTFGYPTNASAVIGFSAGEWTLNGALVYVPYMPYGDNISQIIYVANRGSQNGDITIDAFDQQGAKYSFSGGTVPAGTVMQLSGTIFNALKAAGFSMNGKVAMEITVNAPDQDIDVYSAYNVGGSDRGTVVNSQNGKK